MASIQRPHCLYFLRLVRPFTGSSSSLPFRKDGWFSLLSCTTIYVYVNPSKNASFIVARGGCSSFAGAKVRTFRDMAKTKRTFFAKNLHFREKRG